LDVLFFIASQHDFLFDDFSFVLEFDILHPVELLPVVPDLQQLLSFALSHLVSVVLFELSQLVELVVPLLQQGFCVALSFVTTVVLVELVLCAFTLTAVVKKMKVIETSAGTRKSFFIIYFLILICLNKVNIIFLEQN